MERYWINQPSTIQQRHDLHGRIVLVDMSDTLVDLSGAKCVHVYFTDGDVVSDWIQPIALSRGWPKHLQHARAGRGPTIEVNKF